MGVSRLLYRDAAERERLLDIGMRIRAANLRALAVLLVVLVVAVPVYGWLTAVWLLAGGGLYVAAGWSPLRRLRGDWPAFAVFVCAQATVLAAVALADGPVVYLLCLPLVPMVLSATGFRRETVFACAAGSMAGLTAVTLLTAPEQIAAIPPALSVPVLLLFVLTLSAMAVRDADMVTRSDAVVDELTGLLNRVALQARVAEITHQVRAPGGRVALIFADIDHFKQINDTLGHAAGDRVLAETARRLTAAADGAPVYRFGGEEFTVLLPGADEAAAQDVAERMRQALRASPIEGRTVTASLGVAVSPGEAEFDYRRLFSEADGALYRAKALGRDQIRVSGGSDEPLRAVSARSTRTPAEPGAPFAAASTPAPGHRDGNWLAGDAIARAHLVDLLTRTRSYTQVTSALVAIAIVSMVPWLGWEMLIPVVVSGAIVEGATRAAVTHPRPEFLFLGAFVVMQLGAAAAVLVAGADILFALPIFAIAMFGCGASLPGPGTAVLVATGCVTMAASALAAGGPEIAANPTILALPMATTAALAMVGSAIGARVAELRVAAVSDGLTGALNRVALEARIAELSQRPPGRESVSLIVADLDHFKAINDEHGHEVGDHVLAEVADRIRGQLRAFDALYRIGGEEFVVLLDDAGPDVAAAVAERIRAAVERAPAAGAPVTVSLGLASAPAGLPLHYDATFALADSALLTAKREGRNGVVVAATTMVAWDAGGTAAGLRDR